MKKLLVILLALALAAPAMADKLDVKLDSMYMTGPNPYGGPDIVVTMDPTRPSMGHISSDTDFPAESFFDVYVHVEVPPYGGFVLKADESGVRMEAEIDAVPPPAETPYITGSDVRRLLASDDSVEVAIGNILEVLHSSGIYIRKIDYPDGSWMEEFGSSSAEIVVEFPELGLPEETLYVDGGYYIKYLPTRVPSTNVYGLVILILLLIAAGVYVYARRRRGAVPA